VWLAVADDNANRADYLFLTDGAASARVGEFERCFELFDGRDEAALAAARDRWKQYQTAGHALTYWRQTDAGGWKKQE